MANDPSPELVPASDRLRRSFDPVVVARGDLYAHGQRVAIRYGDVNRVSAVVQGTQSYEVALRFTRRVHGEGGALEVSCSCTHANRHLCKHVWATLRVAERRGHLLNAARQRGLLQIVAALATPPSTSTHAEGAVTPSPPSPRWLLDLCESSPYGGPTIDSYERALTLVGAAPRIERIARARVSFGYVTGEALRTRVLDLAEGGRTDVLFDPERPPELLTVDDGGSYRVVLIVEDGAPTTPSMNELVVRGELRRGEEVIALQDLSAVFGVGLAFMGSRALFVDRHAPMRWITVVQRTGELQVPADEAHRFLRELVSKSRRSHFELPPTIELQEGSPLRTHVHVKLPDPEGLGAHRTLYADVVFDYGRGAKASWVDPGGLVIEGAQRRIVVRDREAEHGAVAELVAAGFRIVRTHRERGGLKIGPSRLTGAIMALPGDRFQVAAQGVVHRTASRTSMRVRSGVDWFDVSAGIEFDGIPVSTPALLEAAKRGERMVRLDDGSVGVLPAEWLAQVGRMLDLAAPSANDASADDGSELHLRFARSQLTLVDAVMDGAPSDVAWEGPLARLRQQLASFGELPPAVTPAGFRGELREYQRAGVAWMQWLETVGFSGCLADDMGLGKTIQVLALLARRKEVGGRATSLVVVPRSLVYNWLDEAARFAPRLRVRELTSDTTEEEALGCDLLVTTYGVLRRRVEALAELELDYAILDEAHAIKNAGTITARAASRLRARHRLALTGTPVENHLGELAALFQFLNPGMLGSRMRAAARSGFEIDGAYAAQLGRGLRPFVLRRKKSDVLTELPARIDQTIVCVMPEWQRSIYERVKKYYQAKVHEQIDAEGLAASRFHVFEALLRLRQIACHPGMVDPALRRERSAKQEALFEQLEPIVRQGKKALVFSQFTSLLDIVGDELVTRRVGHTRLDGSTTNRKQLVERFQTDPTCNVFLVSLKAGGVGLNLTAAEVVFVLDPWWNPAAEQQAVDRAHRMGQTKTVLAMRLLCKDTIEERVTELQAKKRALVASVFTETEGPRLGTLTKEDVDALLA